MKIDRQDMLELTRRMTVSRTCFFRMAGAYMDTEGEIDDSFNIHFLKLSGSDQAKNLEIAKTIPFAETNSKLKNYRFKEEKKKPGSVWQLFMALRECELKNDALLYSFYEFIGEQYYSEQPYSINLFYGSYDVPVKGSDKSEQWESEEVYQYLLCAICPLVGDYESGEPVKGFLFPAFANRSTDMDGINIFEEDESGEFARILQMY